MIKATNDWIENTALRLMGGERLLLRLPPRHGKSFLSNLLQGTLGATAIVVDGADFKEANQAEKRSDLDDQLRRAIEKHGSAQLIFDSYDRALSRSQGARLQSWLTNRLIDGKFAQDTGALFTARCSTDVHRAGAGSSLMSRVIPIQPPSIRSVADLPPGLKTAMDWFGDSALLPDRAVVAGQFAPSNLADQIENDTAYISDVRRAAPRQAFLESLDTDEVAYSVRCAVHGLLTGNGRTKLFNRIQPLLTAITEPSPVWPDDWQASITKFGQLVAGFEEVVWSDRYMYRDIEPLRSFLRAVTQNTRCRVQLVGGQTVSDRTITRAEMARLSTIDGVEARWMTASQFPDLHDRHLATGAGGWVIPQVHVIIGRQTPGSAVAAATSAFGVDYWSVWRNAAMP